MNTSLPVQASQHRQISPVTSLDQPAAAAPGPSGGAPDLHFLSAVLRRRWLLIAATVGVITGLAGVYAWTREPVYAASAKLMIGLPHAPAIDLEGLVSGVPVNADRIENEVQILQSRSLARRAIEAGNLDRHPAFNPPPDADAQAMELGELMWSLAEPWMPALAGRMEAWGLAGLLETDQAEAGESVPGRDPMADLVDRFLGGLEVEPEGRSHVINLTFEAEDPELAAKAANTLANAYLEDRLEAKLEASRRATDWLDQRVEDLRKEAEQKEAAVEAYRSRTGLVANAGESLIADRIAELNKELARAKSAEVEAESRSERVQETLESGSDAVPQVLASRTIQELRAQEAVIAAERAELAREYGSRHPRMIDINAQLEGIRDQIRAEVERVREGIRNEYDTARARTARIEEEIARLEDRIRDRNDAEGQLRVLEREAEAAQEAYRAFLMRANTGGQRESLETPDGRLLSAAEVPSAPAGPDRKLLLVLGFIGACFTGVGLSFGLELLDRRFRNPDEIRSKLRLPVLGVVPMLSSLTRTRHAPQDHIVDGPDSAFGEAIRGLRTAMAIQGSRPSPRVVLMTSSVQGEGKTTLCLTIGRQAALSGRKAVVVDCDLRLPRVHEGLGVGNGPGVIEFINGAGFAEVQQIDPRTGLHYVSAGHWRRNAPELLGHPRMRELISLLRARYDLVLIDTPPLLPVTDASVIAGLTDLALLVIGWPNARPDTVEVAASRLRAAASRATIGAIFNNVDVHKVTGYGFAEIEAYRGGYANYYAAA